MTHLQETCAALLATQRQINRLAFTQAECRRAKADANVPWIGDLIAQNEQALAVIAGCFQFHSAANDGRLAPTPEAA